MENKLNVPKLEYKTGEPMWVHWHIWTTNQ